MSPQFQPYLESIRATYAKWWELYTLTDAAGKERQTKQGAPTFDFGLMVQTVKKEERREEEKSERFPVLEGIRKYAEQHVLLIGRPGSGKSTALARLMLEEATIAPSRLPVLVELRYWQGSIEQLIRDSLTRHDLPVELFEEALGRSLLLFDGINELPSEEARSQLSAFRRNHPKLPMIFTTRDLSLGGDLGIEKKLEMQPLTEAQMQAFIRAYVPEQAEQMLRQLKREFGQTPLLLWMLCGLFQQTGTIPENLGLVFREFTQGYERYLKDDVRIESDRSWWKPVLQQLAWVMMQGEKPTELRVAIGREEAVRAIGQYLEEKVPYAEDFARKCLRDLQKYHLIQAGASQEEIEFRHQLIQEYYAAEALLEHLSELNDVRLNQEFLNFLKWTEPIALMLALVKTEEQALRIVKLAIQVDLMLGARLAGEVQSDFQLQTIAMLDRYKFRNGQNAQDWLKLSLFQKSRSNAAIPKINAILEQGEIGILPEATRVLGQIGTTDAIQVLINTLMLHKSQNARYSAAEVLGKIGATQAIPALQTALHDEALSVACAAVDTLSKLSVPEAIPALLEALRHNSGNVTKRAIQGLIKFEKTEVMPLLQPIVENSDDRVREKVFRVLASFSPKKKDESYQFQDKKEISLPIDCLIEAFQNESSDVYYEARESLQKLSSEEVVSKLIALLEHSQTQVQCRAADLLGEMQAQLAIPYLLSRSNSPDGLVRRQVAFALGKLGSKHSVPLLVSYLSSSHWYDRNEAAKVLGELRAEQAVVALIRNLEDEEREVRFSAAEALGRIGAEEVIPKLIHLLRNDKDSLVRYYVMEALANIGSESAVLVLLDAWKMRIEQPVDIADLLISIKKDSIIYALPYLVEMIPSETWNPILTAIDGIQTYCKYYDYNIYQDYLEAQKNDRYPPQNHDRSFIFPNANEVKIFEKVDRYYETNPDNKENER